MRAGCSGLQHGRQRGGSVPAFADRRAGQFRRMAGGHGSPVQVYFEAADRYMSEAIEAGELRPKPGVRGLTEARTSGT